MFDNHIMIEFISGVQIGFELFDDDEEGIAYLLINLGIIRLNINWDYD